MSDAVPTIALEEHFAIPEIQSRTRHTFGPEAFEPDGPVEQALYELGDRRLAAMDAIGVDIQVISHTAPGLEHLPDPDAPALARLANDVLIEAVGRHPTRFAGFATLPTHDPAACAEELRRTARLGLCGALINGSAAGRFLDHPAFDDLLTVAEEQSVPLYVHPGVAPRAVIDAYYGGLPEPVSRMLATAAWGWHAETAVQVLRLAVSGAFERHPGLQLIIGHLGEMLPVMLDRSSMLLSPRAGLPRSIRDYITGHVHVTLAGFYSVPSFQATVQSFGMDRMMFSTDYPYVPGPPARQFLDTVPLSAADRARLAGGNAMALLRLGTAGRQNIG